jgi:hypothetical protein
MRPAILRLGGEGVYRHPHRSSGVGSNHLARTTKSVETTTRKPMLLFLLSGLFLFR